MKHRYSHPTAFDYKKPFGKRSGLEFLRYKCKHLPKQAMLIAAAIIIVGGAGGGLVLARRGGGGSVAEQALLLLQSPLNKALVKSFGSNGIQSAKVNATVTFSGPNIPPALNNLSADGVVDRQGRADMVFTTDISGSRVSLYEIATDSRHYYSRLDGVGDVNTLQKNITDPSFAQKVQLAAPILAALNGAWYNIDGQAISQAFGAANGNSNAASEVSSQTSIGDIYRKSPFFFQKKQLADDVIDGESVAHVSVVVDKSQLVNFITRARAKGGPLAELHDSQYQKLWQAIKATDFNAQPFDVWFEKDTMYLRKVVATIELTNYNVKLAVNLSDINKPIKPQAPDNPRNTQDMLNALLPILQPALP